MNRITRAWSALAPKLIAFLATGLTASAVIGAGQLFGLDIPAAPAVFVVGLVAVVAGYVQRDNLLTLPWDVAAPKLIAFALSSITATGVLLGADAFGIDLSQHSGLISAAVIVIGAIAGYIKSDASTR